MAKRQVFYIFQGFDGFLYGTLYLWSPQEDGKANAALRRAAASGRWVPQHLLTENEKAKHGTPETAARLRATCDSLPVNVLRIANLYSAATQ